MALLKWTNDDDEENKDDSLLNPTNSVRSVQDSWQPSAQQPDASQNAAQNGQAKGIFDQPQQQNLMSQNDNNYLLSDQKAQVDQQLAARRAAEAEARRQAAAQAAAARAQAAQAAAEQSAYAAAQQQAAQARAFRQGNVPNVNVQQAKNDNGWRKYYDQAFNREKSQQNFFERLLDNGGASRRAEIAARNMYINRDVNAKAFANGQVVNQAAAAQSRNLAGYNSAFAQNNAAQNMAIARSIGATRDNQANGFGDNVRNTINAMKNMSVFDATFGVDDKQKTGFDDAGRFVGNLVQGVFTSPVVGGKEIVESATGRGTDAETGFEKNLNDLERFGRAGSGVFNTALAFTGGSGKLLTSIAGKAANGTATAAEKTFLQQALKQIAAPAAEQGAIGAAQAGSEYFGNGNTLVNDKGEFDPNKLGELAKQVGQAGAMSAVGGATLAGGARGISRLRNGKVVDSADLQNIETGTTNSLESQLSKQRAMSDSSNVDLSQLEQQAADGVVTTTNEPTATPTNEPAVTPTGNTPEVTPTRDAPTVSSDGSNMPPANLPALASAPMLGEPSKVVPVSAVDNSMPVVEQRVVDQQAIDEPKIQEPAVTNEQAPVDTPAEPAATTPDPADAPVVADGVATDPAQATDFPAVDTEATVRQLQDARAGASQAEEAGINQQLQEVEKAAPRIVYRGGDASGFDPNKVTEKGVSVATDRENAQWFGGGYDPEYAATSGMSVQELHLSPDAKILNLNDIPADVVSKSKALNDDGTTLKEELALVRYAKDNGYDAIDVAPWGEAEIRVINPDILSPDGNFTRKEVAADDREAGFDQQLQQIKNATPTEQSNLPDAMQGETVPVEPSTSEQMVKDGRKQLANAFMGKMGEETGIKQQLANAVGMDKDATSGVRTFMTDAGIDPKKVDRISNLTEQLDALGTKYNQYTKDNRKSYVTGGSDAISMDNTKAQSVITRQANSIKQQLLSEVKALESNKAVKARILHEIEAAVAFRNANMLSSMGGIERNISQELTANAIAFAKNPVKSARGMFDPHNISSAASSAKEGWKATPKSLTPMGWTKHVVGNVYNTAMIPTTALTNARKDMYRVELTKHAVKAAEGRDISTDEARRIGRTAGNETEALVNMFAGVDNGMASDKATKEAFDAWKQFMASGSEGDKSLMMARLESQSTLAQKLVQGISESDKFNGQFTKAFINTVFPFVTTAANLGTKFVRRDLHPFSQSLVDSIRADQRNGFQNAGLVLKNKLVDYGIVAGVAGLVSAGVIGYNDGDDPTKPRGVYIKLDNDHYIPVRATSLELPIVMTVAAHQLATDVANGKPRDAGYYASMVSGSLPYIDAMNQTTGAISSAGALLNGDSTVGIKSGDAGYAAKSYGVNLAKSLVPFSNNGVQSGVAALQDKSLDAKTVYNKDTGKWLGQAVRSAYDPAFRDTLSTSRDAAGQARTVDNQGVVVNKRVNDAGTKEFHDRIDDLVKFSRDNKLGNGVKDMFNSFDNDRNNNFHSAQGTISFLDGNSDAKNKLKKNDKLADLARQQKEAFFGGDASAFLMLDGKELKSDAASPSGKQGLKNSPSPLSMQSIVNSISQSDLPEEQRNRVNELSQANQALYNQKHNKQMSYEEYAAAKAANDQELTGILRNSKNFQRLNGFMNKLNDTGFFEPNGLGSTKSGQIYLFNMFNSMIGTKGTTPFANRPDDSGNGFTPWGRRGFTPWGRRGGSGGDGFNATIKSSDSGVDGVKWTPVKARQMAQVGSAQFTPLDIRVKLGSQIKKDKTQDYTDRMF